MGKPTGFLEYTRREDRRRPPAERVRDWEEFHLPLPEDQRREKWERIDVAVDQLRQRYGYMSVRRALVMADPMLSKINPKDDHIVHPVGFFGG